MNQFFFAVEKSFIASVSLHTYFEKGYIITKILHNWYENECIYENIFYEIDKKIGLNTHGSNEKYHTYNIQIVIFSRELFVQIFFVKKIKYFKQISV